VRIFTLFLILILFSGCSTVTPSREMIEISTAKTFKEKIQLFNQYKGFQRKDLVGHADFLCRKAYNNRLYDFFSECVLYYKQDGFKNIFAPNEEHKHYFHKWEVSYQNWMSIIYAYQAMLYLELNDLHKSKIFINKSKETVRYNRSESDYINFEQLYIEGLIVGAKGEYDLVRSNISKLKNLGPQCFKYNQCKITKDTAVKHEYLRRIMSLHIAMKDYSGVKSFLNEESKANITKYVELLTTGTLGVIGLVLGDISGATQFLSSASGLIKESNYNNTLLTYTELKIGFETEKSRALLELYEKFIKKTDVKKYINIYYSALHDTAILKNIYRPSDNNIYFTEAIKEIERHRTLLNTEASKIGFFADRQRVYSDYVNYLFEQKKHLNAFKIVEQSKARALVDVLASKKNFDASSKKSSELLSELDKAEYDALQFASNASRTRSVVIQQNIEATDKQLSSLISVKSTTVSGIQSKLKKNEVLIEYYGNEEKYFIFVLTKNSIKSVKIDSSNLENHVTNYRAALSTRDSKKYKSASKALYNTVIKPVKHLIKGKKLTVVPHGSLHYVPFASLWDGKRYLVQNYQIRTLPSASVMEFLQNKVTNKAGNLLILGNPDLGDPQYDLPAAQEESLRLAKRVKGSKVLLRKKATETALKKYGSSFKNIHFAMHGLFEAEKPLSSGLFLAPDSENDGRLTVSELYDLDLNADLVTLSACETALGETKSGDDVIGFTRGFLYAGANSIVSSLWEVDDEATRDLMLRFYKELKSNNKARALQKAQLRVMKKYPHPYYWAAFQLTGQY
jgi:CHAT domain-containing protein